jgi:phospholipid/cholesterol/gamma-HCH transport system substrate-binding protein
MKISKEFKIGLAGIAALFILIYGINFLKGINMFKPASYFYVKFADVNGLAKSSPVYADGVRVGIVRSISYDYSQSGNVIVEVEVDNDLRIPMGSSAELVSELMGGVRMNLLLANSLR